MSAYKNKILVALDGSERAFKTVKYLCSFKPFLKKELVLHNILTKVPESYYDLKKDPLSFQATSRLQAWEAGYRSRMEEFMEKSKAMLQKAGFKPEAIRIVIAERNRGIARDIMDEARKGYDALLIRRRGGAQKLLPLVMGSVSKKLVEKGDTLPILLAGVQKVNHSLCIAVDGSEGSKKAVTFCADLIAGSQCRVVLCSVLRDFQMDDGEKRLDSPDSCTSEVFRGIETAIREAGAVLEKAGIPRNRIEAKIIQGAQSRAQALIEAAREEKCDTLVFGRKGISKVEGFDIGRVPWQVIHGAKKMTVWMVP